jgi:hypothetical protein
VQVAADAAELGGGLDHAGGAAGQGHLPVAPAFDLGRVDAADGEQALNAVVDNSVLARVGGTPIRGTMSVSCRPSRSDAATPG